MTWKRTGRRMPSHIWRALEEPAVGGRVEGGGKEVERRGGKEVDEVWGQRWLPVCLWNTSQLALTIKSMQENYCGLFEQSGWC